MLEKLLADPGRQEARDWLQAAGTSRRTLGILSASESVALVEQAYATGVQTVWVTKISGRTVGDIDGDYLAETSQTLAVELPDNSTARKRVFRWAGKLARAIGFDPTPDVGQRHLIVLLS